MDSLTPTIDPKLLQEAVNAAAFKGAVLAINDYYNGYNAPFRKMIIEHCEAQPVGDFLKLPDIVAQINVALTNEIDKIVNMAISNTFIPLFRKKIYLAKKNVGFSEILLNYLESTSSAVDDCNCVIDKVYVVKDSYWLLITLSTGVDLKYEFRFHPIRNKEGKYALYSLPTTSNANQTMEIVKDKITLKIPFIPNILQDDFLSFLASLIIGDSEIEMDVAQFDELMFEED